MLLIKQAQIVDGSGSKPYVGDVLINGEKISAIGKSFSRKKAKEVINGLGLVLAPGFIDVNNDSDHHLTLFTNPGQQDFINQGITTIIGGQCGASLAPLMYGSLASMGQWTVTDRVNVDWTNLGELRLILKKIGLAINFETLVGYNTIRRDLAGVEIRDLTEAELKIFSKVLVQALDNGALGLSTGLGFLDSKFTPYNEIKKLVSVIAKRGGIYATHLRDEKEDLVRSVEEALMISRETGAKTIVSHFRPLRGYEKQFGEALTLIEKNLTNSNIYFDVNPFTATIFPIHTYLPYWAQNESAEVMLNNLRDSEKRKMIIKELEKDGLEELVVADARGQEVIVGKSLLDLSRSWEIDVVSVLLNLMESTRMRAMLMSKKINNDLLMPLISHSRSLIGSNSASFSSSASNGQLKLDRTIKTFTKYLEIMAGQGAPIESVIKKITFLPAQIFGLKNRGLIKEGYMANLVLLKGNEVKNVILNGKKYNVIGIQ